MRKNNCCDYNPTICAKELQMSMFKMKKFTIECRVKSLQCRTRTDITSNMVELVFIVFIVVIIFFVYFAWLFLNKF